MSREDPQILLLCVGKLINIFGCSTSDDWTFSKLDLNLLEEVIFPGRKRNGGSSRNC